MTNSIKELLSKLSDIHSAEQDRLQKKEKERENFNVFSALNMCSDEMRLHCKHPKLAVFCGCSIVATFAQKRCLH